MDSSLATYCYPFYQIKGELPAHKSYCKAQLPMGTSHHTSLVADTSGDDANFACGAASYGSFHGACLHDSHL